MKEQIIQLEPHDDATSVRDKLGWLRAPRVLLVFPDDPRQRILQTRLDLVLIQREATRRRAQLALITRDPIVAEHARDLGIACFRTIEASRRRFWRTARARLEVPREERPAPLDADLVEAGTRLRPDRPMIPPGLRRAAVLAVAAFLLALLLTGAYLLLPGASVTLTPAANQITVTTTITADPDTALVDADQAIISARMLGIEVEASTTIDTTGTRQQPTEKARGIALFTNLVPGQVTIPTGTAVRTSAAQPVRFVTLTDVTLPGRIGETVEVAIEALDPGFVGNLPANRINQVEGALASRVAVTNPEPTRGGDAAEVRAVSQDDYERLRGILLQQLQQRAYAEMQTTLLANNEFIPIESLRVVLIHSETYSGYAGEIRDDLTLNMRVTVQGVAINELQAREVVYTRLAERVGTGYRIGADSLIFRRGEVTQVEEGRRVTFVMQGAGDVQAAVDPESVRQMVRGLSLREAALRLNQSLTLAAPPRIEVWPDFWPLMPALPYRIDVRVEGQL